MKSYNEFMEYIKENVTDYLPERFEEAEISIQQVVKNNDVVLDGLSIRNPDSNISPNIYLNPLYEQYQKGRNLDELVSGIADTYIENMEPIENRTFQVQIEDIKNYEVVKEEIFPRLVNLEKNTTRLQNVPYMQREDLAITYHVKVSENRDSIGSLMITNELMEVYGVTKEKLHTQAMENMERLSPPVFLPLGEMIVDVMTEDFGRNEGVSQEEAKEYVKDMIPTGGPNVYCLTNQYKMNGAVGIMSESIQQMVADRVGGDYYVLPSSVHEVLIVPQSASMDPEELTDMVNTVNEGCVMQDEILSDHVYQYDAKEHKLSLCAPAKEMKQEQTMEQNRQPAFEEKSIDATKPPEQSHEPIKHSGRSH